MPIDTAVKLLKKRRTKIVATLGPASSDPATIGRLIRAGVNIFRLNMSHGMYEHHRVNFERIRAAARDADAAIAVLADLSGPKMRVGEFPGGPIELAEESTVTMTTRDLPGAPGLIPSQYRKLAGDVQPGNRILLADGVMELLVENVEDTEVSCRVIQGGILSERQGINLPGVEVSAPALTDKDREDARFAMQLGVDFLALSFVRHASDLAELKSLIAESGSQVATIAKIERPEALAEIEGILDLADGIMVARGDLGVELPPEQVPVAQRLLVDHARAKDKPVIVATQMLDSMIENARPTRAEVADVSLTVSSGADAVMLSGETAVGRYPVQAVQMMDRIARQTESYLWRHGAFGSFSQDHITRPLPFGVAVGNATALLSRDLRVRMIFVVSPWGISAREVSAARPSAPVVAVSSQDATCRRMGLLWGVIPVRVGPGEIDDPISLSSQMAKDLDFAESGDHILLVRGFHIDPEKNAPTITVLGV